MPITETVVPSVPFCAQQMVATNLLGSMFGSRAAMRVMAAQPPRGGKIFLVDGQARTPLACAALCCLSQISRILCSRLHSLHSIASQS